MADQRQYTESQLAAFKAMRAMAFELANASDDEFDPAGNYNPALERLCEKAIPPEPGRLDLNLGALEAWCVELLDGGFGEYHHEPSAELAADAEMLRLDCQRMKFLLNQKGSA